MGLKHRGCFGEGLLANIGEREVTATLGETERQRPADAAAGAGDDCG
jgi:hypothetical protein